MFDGREELKNNPSPLKFHVFRENGKVVRIFPAAMTEKESRQFEDFQRNRKYVRAGEWFKSLEDANKAYGIDQGIIDKILK